MNKRQYSLVYLNGGLGHRTELMYPKQLYTLGGKPMFLIALEILDRVVKFEDIIITVPKDYFDSFVDIIRLIEFNCSHVVILEGGSTRQESVYKALQECSTQYTIIHEGVRPFITEDLVQRLVDSKDKAPVVPVLDIPFSVYYDDPYILLDRSKVSNIQLPQLFNTKELKIAHKLAKDNNQSFTEDSNMVKYTFKKKKLTLIPGLHENIKVTTPFDITIAEAYYEKNNGTDRSL